MERAIARFNERLTVQKNTVTVDRYGNHKNVWTDYFTCSAYANTYTAQEDGEEVTYEERTVAFETRYCPELASVSSTGFRVLFGDVAYEIVSVDPMNYQNQTLKFTCRREKRQA